jgi:hypothetical protein
MSDKLRELWERFKQLPTVYKIAIIGGVVIVGIIVYNLVKNRSAASSTNASPTDSSALPSLPSLDNLGLPSVPVTDNTAYQNPFNTSDVQIPPVWTTGPGDSTDPTRAATTTPLRVITQGYDIHEAAATIAAKNAADQHAGAVTHSYDILAASQANAQKASVAQAAKDQAMNARYLTAAPTPAPPPTQRRTNVSYQ